jgi:hypothetical protein
MNKVIKILQRTVLLLESQINNIILRMGVQRIVDFLIIYLIQLYSMNLLIRIRTLLSLELEQFRIL